MLQESPPQALTFDDVSLVPAHSEVHPQQVDTTTVLTQAIDLEKSRGHSPELILRLAALLHDIG